VRVATLGMDQQQGEGGAKREGNGRREGLECGHCLLRSLTPLGWPLVCLLGGVRTRDSNDDETASQPVIG